MINPAKILYLTLLGGSILISGCLKDNVSTSPEFSLDESSKLLFYLEETGDYINSSEMPSLANVDEVHENMQSYLLIDIRPHEEYLDGHIENSINKQHQELISFLDSTDSSHFPKIIIISENGQSASFYTCLLRLYGFDNVFSMNYGMAAWNNHFSSQWLAALQQDDGIIEAFTYLAAFRPAFTSLPQVDLSGESLSEKVKNRIKSIINTNFADNFTGTKGDATIDFLYLVAHINQYFIGCYDTDLLYKQNNIHIVHPATAVLYTPPPASDLSSTSYLQTLPSNRPITFYSADGQLSAFATAYLRVLGYDAKSILFGANNMFYDILAGEPSISDKAFTVDKIHDYPYVTGN